MAAANESSSIRVQAAAMESAAALRPHKRPPRACTARTPARLARLAPTVERSTHRKQQASAESEPFAPMALASPLPLAQKQRWDLRSMWELASIFNFLNVFRPVLKLGFEFSLEELETALITPNTTLDDIHIALVKAIPPISRSPLGRDTWVTVLCKKLKDWWRWVADNPFPLVPHHGEEIAAYMELDPQVRVIILKALCEVRLDQDDIRAYIDDSLKQGAPFSTFRKERLGVDVLGNTYWYENDPIAGQRLYRDLRKVDNKLKIKVRGRAVPPPTNYNWETLATNLEEFEAVAEKLASSRNRLELAIGKRILVDIIPELDDLQKKRERALKRQQRQATLLDSFLNYGRTAVGRSRRERKPVSYTFDDFDKSISEAIKLTKRKPSPERRIEYMTNGETPATQDTFTADQVESDHQILHSDIASESKSDEAQKSESKNDEEIWKNDEEANSSDSKLTPNAERVRSLKIYKNRQHRRPQRYSEKEYIEAVSDNEADAYSDDEIEGEAVYDDDYVKKKKSGKLFVTSDGDEDYCGEEDVEDEDDDYDNDTDFDDTDFSHVKHRQYRKNNKRRRGKMKYISDDEDDDMDMSDDEDYMQRRQNKRYAFRGRGKGRGKVKTVNELQRGLRRSKRVTKTNINYSKYEESDYDDDDGYSEEPEKIQRDEDTSRIRQNARIHSDNIPAETAHGSSSEASGGEATQMVNDYRQTDEGFLLTNSCKPPAIISSNGVKSSTAETASGNKQRQLLDLNLIAPLGGGNDDGSDDETNAQAGTLNEFSQGSSGNTDADKGGMP